MHTIVEPAERPLSVWGRITRRLNLLHRFGPRLRKPAAYWNWARANWQWRIRARQVTARPLKLTIDPTNACHLRCPLCPTGRRELDRAHGHLDPVLFERLLEETGDTLFFIDFFNWGEPFLNPHTEDLVASAARRGIVCALSSNLSLPLAASRIRRIVSSGLHELIISLDGATPETYVQYRKGGDFELVCENVRQLVAERKRQGLTRPLLTWQFLVFSHNEHEREAAARMAAEMGVDRICFRPPMLHIDEPDLQLPDRETLLAWAPEDKTFRVPRKDLKSCSWHYMSSAINWDGSVAPCCGVHSKRDDFGSLANGTTYMEVLNNATYRAARGETDGAGLICASCPVPSIQDYHRDLNRQIAIHTLAAITG